MSANALFGNYFCSGRCIGILLQLLIVLVSCSSRDIHTLNSQKINIQSGKLQYRTLVTPLDDFTTVYASSTKFHNSYIRWHAAHQRLLLALEKGTLATIEAHRKILHYFNTIIAHCPAKTAKVLKIYLPIYQNLLEQLQNGGTHRNLRRQYNSLKKRIDGTLRIEAIPSQEANSTNVHLKCVRGGGTHSAPLFLLY